MSTTTPRFWEDERGFIVSAELTIISTVLVLSLVVGMSGLSTTITDEFASMANHGNPSLPVERYSTLGFDQTQTLPQAPPPAISVNPESTAG